MICEVYRRHSRFPWKPKSRSGWSFRWKFNNGAIPNHVYRDATDAARGAHDFVAELCSGDVTFRIIEDNERTQ